MTKEEQIKQIELKIQKNNKTIEELKILIDKVEVMLSLAMVDKLN